MSEQFNEPLLYESLPIDSEISLRQLQISEAKVIFDTVNRNRDYLSTWLPWVEHTNSPSDSEQFIKDTLRKRHESSEYGYGIIVDGKPVGHISLMHVKDGKHPEIGYWIDESVSGRGIVSKATEALTDFGFHTLGLHKIVLRIHPNNKASRRVAEKLGFTLTGTDYDEVHGHDLSIWSKTKADKIS